jgi:hypothetical protein
LSLCETKWPLPGLTSKENVKGPQGARVAGKNEAAESNLGGGRL